MMLGGGPGCLRVRDRPREFSRAAIKAIKGPLPDAGVGFRVGLPKVAVLALIVVREMQANK